jgi:hypothetical protein
MLAILVTAGVIGATGATAGAQETDSMPLTPSAALEPVEVEPLVVEDAPDQPAPIIAPAPAGGDGESCACANCAGGSEKTCCTKEQQQAALDKMKDAYKGVFYANNFSYLNDPCYRGPSFLGDGLKGLCDNRLDLGGEARVRFHSEQNMRGFGLTGLDDNFWLTRYRTFANYRLHDDIRLYGEYLYADSAGETFNNRTIEENRGEMQNLFFDAKLTDRATLRMGRQELLYGNQRLVSPLDWANTRRTFDGGRLLYQGDTWSIDGFMTHPVNRTPENESKIDDADENVDFYGVYATRGDLSIGTLDVYYLGLDNSDLDFDYQTVGSRVVGKSSGGLLYEFEGGYQFGTNSPGFGSHDAGFVAAGLGRQIAVTTTWKPTVWFWYDWASGGDEIPAARGDDGFDHLYPLAHKYNGFMDLFGRRNLHDINAQFITPVLGSSKLNLLLWYHYFLLAEKTTPYNITMAPFNPNNAAGDRELGHELDVLLSVTLNPRNSMLLGYSFFSAGDYYDTTVGVPSNSDAQFFYMQYQTQF